MQVTDPSGKTWRVERRLVQLPHWRRTRRPSLDGAVDGLDAVGYVDGLEALGIALAVLLVILLSIVFVFPLLILIVELVLAGLLLVGRFLLGRWTVVAVTHDERRSWHVRGHRESKRFAAEVADALRSGSVLPPEPA